MLGNVSITGKENIPYGKPYVVAINHVSIFDPPFAGAFWPDRLEIIGAADVFDKPSQGWLLKGYGVIPVHRGDYDRLLLTKIIPHPQIRFSTFDRARRRTLARALPCAAQSRASPTSLNKRCACAACRAGRNDRRFLATRQARQKTSS
jgi:1-acyl-sn-glycerol-3-phosphate acyltransferase